MMKVDFSRLRIKQIDGSDFPQAENERVRKMVGNRLYYQSRDVGDSELGRKIWHADGELELSDKELETLRRELMELPAVTRRAFESLLNG